MDDQHLEQTDMVLPSVMSSSQETGGGFVATSCCGLTQDQAKAFYTITGRISHGQQVTKLVGAAGTGKTFTLSKVAKWATGEGFRVSVAAPTHKAAGVIADKLLRDSVELEVNTIHSLLGLLLVPDFENDTGGRILTAPERKDNKKEKVEGNSNALIICDEASMLGCVLKGHIDQRRDVQWLFVGDDAQLPPVGEGTSEMLRDPDAVLTKVVRQAEGSSIIRLATRIRRGDLSMKLPPSELSGDVVRAKDQGELFVAALERFDSDEGRQDPSHARVLVFRNARRKEFNKAIRDLLVGRPEPWVEGEWLVMHNQFCPSSSKLNQLRERAKTFTKGQWQYGGAWSAFFREKERQEEQAEQGVREPFLHVSQEVKVLHVSEGVIPAEGRGFSVWHLTVLDQEGNTHLLPVLKEEALPSHRGVADAIAAEARSIRAELDALEGRGHDRSSHDWQEADQRRRRCWGRWFGLEDTFAVADHHYASTTHKAQGSTYQHALVDVQDLLLSGGMRKRICYTAVTRPAKTLTFCL